MSGRQSSVSKCKVVVLYPVFPYPRRSSRLANVVVPLRQKLFAFGGVRVRSGATATLDFELNVEQFAVANEDGR